uniref:Coronin n=1 Tax=Ditylenchus dipsaci TaxID=166011 RepID=A0A915DP12_9BILA
MNKGEITRCIEAHGMPLTCVDMHRALGPIMDVKDDSITSPLITFKGLQSLHIADVQWSPVHPAVFATASIDGILNLWNLNESTKRYIVSLKISGSITKLMWSRNGKQLSVADIEGRVFLYDVNEVCTT